MITKDNTVEKLKSLGYEAYLEDGVVMVNLDDFKHIRAVHKVLKEIGYNASFGFRYKNRDIKNA